LFRTDETGKIKTDEKGAAAEVKEFTRNGKVYLHQVARLKITLTAAELDRNAGVFLVHNVMSQQDPQKGEVHVGIAYYILKILDNIVVAYMPPAPGDTGLDAAFRNAGVVYKMGGSKLAAGERFVFSDKTQLFAAARIYASRLVEGTIMRYRIVSTKQDVTALQQEIEAGRSKEPPPKAASAGAQADGSAQQECDALAAHAYDQSRPAGVPGVQFEKIDAPRAEAACRRAVQEHPSSRLYAQLGRALHAGHKYADAVANYRVAADQGNALGQNSLGTMYENGQGIARDPAQAAFWYRKAAEQGYAPAQDNLGALYANGEGVRKDMAQAMALFRKAAEQSWANAELNLGRMYDNNGDRTDYAQAAAWYRKAAEHGSVEAQNSLGSMYYNGLGVAENDQEAIFWFKKAAAAGDVTAQRNLERVEADHRRRSAASEVDSTRREIEQDRRNRCNAAQWTHDRMMMSIIPGCY
jgi:TPR repeat protein